jgi:hypothetical protein
MEIPAPDNATTVFEVRKSSPPLILEWIKQNVVTTVLTAIAIVFVYAFFSVKRYRESVIKQASNTLVLVNDPDGYSIRMVP